MLDELGIIHMNGRIYDPLIGRFMSADPYIQAPDNLQSYNRYAYVMNNPLLYTDPTGYFSWRGVFNVVIAIAQPLIAILPPKIASVVYGIASVWCGPYAYVCNGVAQAAIAYYNGATWQQALRAGSIAAATTWLFQQAGKVAPTGVNPASVEAANSFERYAAHAAAGCATSVAGGGKCGQGAASALVGKYTTNAIGVTPGNFDAFQFTATVVAGGVASVIGGGKFANGAETAAYGYLFNQALSKAEADAKANARNNQVMQGRGCAAEAASSCAGLPVTSGHKDPATQEAVFKLAVSMSGTGAVVVGAIEVVTIGDQLFNNDLGGAAITASSKAVDQIATEVAVKFYSSTTAGRIGAVAGAAWEYIVNLFK